MRRRSYDYPRALHCYDDSCEPTRTLILFESPPGKYSLCTLECGVVQNVGWPFVRMPSANEARLAFTCGWESVPHLL
jgi:hypothetical protein